MTRRPPGFKRSKISHSQEHMTAQLVQNSLEVIGNVAMHNISTNARVAESTNASVIESNARVVEKNTQVFLTAVTAVKDLVQSQIQMSAPEAVGADAGNDDDDDDDDDDDEEEEEEVEESFLLSKEEEEEEVEESILLSKEEEKCIKEFFESESINTRDKKALKKSDETLYCCRRKLVLTMIKKVVPSWSHEALTFTWKFHHGDESTNGQGTTAAGRLSQGLRQLYPGDGTKNGKICCCDYLQRRVGKCAVYQAFKKVIRAKNSNIWYCHIEPEFVALLSAIALTQGMEDGTNFRFDPNQPVLVNVTLTLRKDWEHITIPMDQKATIALAITLGTFYEARRIEWHAATTTPVFTTYQDTHEITPEITHDLYITQDGGDDTKIKSGRPIDALFGILRNPEISTYILWVGCGQAQEIKEIIHKNWNREATDTDKFKYKIFGMDINVYNAQNVTESGPSLQLEYGCDCAFDLADRVDKRWPSAWDQQGEIIIYTTALCGPAFCYLLVLQLKQLLLKPKFSNMNISFVCGFGEAIKYMVGANDLFPTEPAIQAQTTGNTTFTMKKIRWRSIREIPIEVTWSCMQAELLKDIRLILEYKYAKLDIDTLRFDRFSFHNRNTRESKATIQRLRKKYHSAYEPVEMKTTLKDLNGLFSWGWDSVQMTTAAVTCYLKQEVKDYDWMHSINSYLENNVAYTDAYRAKEISDDARISALIIRNGKRNRERKKQKLSEHPPEHKRQDPDAEQKSVVDIDKLTEALMRINLNRKEEIDNNASRREHLLRLFRSGLERTSRHVIICIGMHELKGTEEELTLQYNKFSDKDKEQAAPILDTIRLKNLEKHAGRECELIAVSSNAHSHLLQEATSRSLNLCIRNDTEVFSNLTIPYLISQAVKYVFVDYNRMPTAYLDKLLMGVPREPGIIQLNVLAYAMRKGAKVYIPWPWPKENVPRFQERLTNDTCCLFDFEFHTLKSHPLWVADAELPAEYFNHEDSNETNNQYVPLLVMTRNSTSTKL
jgi:hypothetical protein